MIDNITGVILAGGANKRFNGIIKSNIIINGRKVISRITDALKDIFDDIIIVTNTPEEFREFRNYMIVHDQHLNKGPLGGIHAALKASANRSVFVFGGDMPLLNKGLIINQIEFFDYSRCDVLVPQMNSKTEPLHSLYNTTIINRLEEFLTVGNDFAVREFLKCVNVKYMQLEDTEEARIAFTNINYPSDIEKVENYLRKQ